MNAPLPRLLRVGCITAVLALGGWLVLRAQRSAPTPEAPRATTERPADADAAPTGPASYRPTGPPPGLEPGFSGIDSHHPPAGSHLDSSSRAPGSDMLERIQGEAGDPPE